MYNISLPDASPVEAISRTLVEQTISLSVVTHEDYLAVGEHLKTIARAKKQVAALFAEPKAQADKAHKAVCAAEKKLMEPLRAVEAICNREVTSYLVALRKREEAEAALRLAQAESEARRKAEDDQLRFAEALSQSGDAAGAMQALEVEIIPAAVEVAPMEFASRVEGQHIRTVYRAEVTDLMALVKAVAAGQQPLSYLEANIQALNKIATALRGEANIPGVRVVAQNSVVSRSA